MVGAARQGLPVAYAGTHGTGPFADLARAQLTEAGIDVIQPPLPDDDTGFSVAMVDPSGERTFATSLGAEARLGPADLARIEPAPGDVVYVSGYSLAYPSNGPALAGWLPTLDPGITVIVDPGPLVAEIPAPVLASALERADWWSCNEREARLLTDLADPVTAATALADPDRPRRCARPYRAGRRRARRGRSATGRRTRVPGGGGGQQRCGRRPRGRLRGGARPGARPGRRRTPGQRRRRARRHASGTRHRTDRRRGGRPARRHRSGRLTPC